MTAPAAPRLRETPGFRTHQQEREQPGERLLRILVAMAIPVTLSLNLPLSGQITSGVIAAFLLAPVWLPAFLRTGPGTVIFVAGAIFIGSGFLLGWVSQHDHEIVGSFAVTAAITFAMNLCAIGALFWACRTIGAHNVVLLFGCAWLATSLANPASWLDNPWKYGFVLPLAMIVLSTVDRQRSTGLKIAVLLGLAATSILNDSRSVFAMFLVTALILAWQRLRPASSREPSIAAFLAVAVVLAGALYYTLTRLLVSGALGEGLKRRSEAQVESSGSLLLGGRPEWTVTIRLFQERVYGFGFGVTPNQRDFELGRQGFDSIHLLSQQNYLKNYVFDAVFRLHSILADLWAAGGFAGLLLAVVLVGYLVSSLARGLAARAATATLTFLTLLALWDIGFSPSYSNLPEVMLAVAVGLAMRAEREARDQLPLAAAVPAPVPRGGR